MAIGSKLSTIIPYGGSHRAVVLGDTVWFYPQCACENTPQVGIVTAIGEGDMVDIVILNAAVGGMQRYEGVCRYGDERLINPPYRKNGCWYPRPTPEEVLKAAQQPAEPVKP